MLYIFSRVDDLEGTGKVGTKHCVALLQHYAKLPHTSAWKEGAPVVGNYLLPKGIAIATFAGGKYSSNSTGNHAAFYLSQNAGGIWVMDQWVNDMTKPRVSKRYIRKKGKLHDGRYADPSNNAEAYSVIE